MSNHDGHSSNEMRAREENPIENDQKDANGSNQSLLIEWHRKNLIFGLTKGANEDLVPQNCSPFFPFVLYRLD